MYRLRDYLAMLSDDNRVAAYARAIQAQVKPGDRVIELGAGLGFFSVLAARAGAAIVDAVDHNPVIHVGPRIAEANGCADRIRFHHMDILRFVPDAQADVVIGDRRSATPFAGRSLEILIDARTRLLRTGGQLIGRKDTLYVAPCGEPDAFRRMVTRALTHPDVNLSPAATIVRDTPFQCAIASRDLLAPAAAWGDIDYARLDTTSHSGSAEWAVTEPTQVAGLALWFDADLGAGVTMSSAPGGAAATYSQLYLPLRAPIDIRSGESLRVDLAARYSGGDYVWTRGVHAAGGDGVRRVGSVQNSLAERVLDPATFETPAL